jgi:hypothetical protein
MVPVERIAMSGIRIFRIYLLLAVFGPLMAAKVEAQVTYGAPTTATTATLTILPVGGGTGSITSADGHISNCSIGGGICSFAYNIGSSVTLNVTLTGGSTFAWSNGTGNAIACSGSSNCVIPALTITSAVNAVFLAAGSASLPAFFMGVGLNALSNVCPQTSPNQFPNTISIGSVRFWDATQVQWPSVETANDVFNWTWVDPELCVAAISGVKEAHWTLARTPGFATAGAGYTDGTTCSYYVSGSSNPWQVAGQCDPPSDVAANGTGADQYWRDWIGGVVSHTNQPGYWEGTGAWAAGGSSCPGTTPCAHAHVQVWDTWNEPDTGSFWSTTYGTYDGLHRLQDDLYCIVKGGAYYIPGGVTSGVFAQGMVNTSSTGNTVTWVRGTPFSTSWTGTININGTAYTIATVASTTSMTLTTSPGNHTNVLYGEKITQASTAATAEMMGAPLNASDLINLWAAAGGSPDATHVWTGSLSAATYTPTAAPTQLKVAATNETCATVRGAVTQGAGNAVVNTTLFPNYPAQPLDTTATISMPSYHGPTVSTAKAQNLLYCNNSPTSSCVTGGAHLTTEAINFHLKPGGTASTNPAPWEPTLVGYLSNIHAILASAELLKPLYNTESAFSTCGWPTASCDGANVWGINQMNAAYIGALYPYSWSLGIYENELYDWNNGKGGLGPLGAPCTVNAPVGCANVAFDTVYSWIVGSTGLYNSCAITNGAGTSSLYTCPFTTLYPSGSASAAIIWDNAELCTGTFSSTSGTWSGVSCPTQCETVNSAYTKVFDIFGDASTSIPSAGCSAHQVAVGVAPVLVE